MIVIIILRAMILKIFMLVDKIFDTEGDSPLIFLVYNTPLVWKMY